MDTATMNAGNIAFFTSLCLGVLCSPFAFLLIVAILTSRKLRNSLRHVTVVNLVAGELLVLCLYCPIMISIQAGALYPFSCAMTVGLYLVYIALPIGSWGLVLQHIYYLVSLAGIKPRGLSAFAACLLRVVACVLPWVLALIITLVLTFHALSPMHTQDGCRLVMTGLDSGYLLFLTVNEFVPWSLAVILTIVSIVAHTFSRRRSTTASIALLAPSPHPVESPVALNLATLVNVVLMLLPSALLYSLVDPHSVSGFIAAAMVLKSAVLPFVWLSDRNIRKRMAATMRCRCRLDDDAKDEVEDAVSYRSLEEKDLDLKTEKN